MSKMVKCKVCGKEISKGAKCPNCGKDSRCFVSRHKVLTVICGLVIIGALGSVTGGNSNNKISDNKQTSVSVEDSDSKQTSVSVENSDSKQTSVSNENSNKKQMEPELNISASELINAYKENEVKADKMYKGKIVEVNGIVDGINSGIDDKAIVILSDGDEFSFNNIQCCIDDENQDKACELEKGQNVTIIGEASGEIAGTPFIKDCKIK